MEKNHSPIKLTVLISVADVLVDLKNRGYKQQFMRQSAWLYCPELYLTITAEQFNVDESYHFEEVSSPDGDRVLYAICTSDGIKGFLIDTYGVYTDNMSLEMAKKLGMLKQEESPQSWIKTKS
jgi:hypothetical protein